MRKAMLLAAMLAMVLAAAAPAFAQDVIAVDEGDDVEYNAVCQNILGSVGDITQDQAGDASAVADDDSAAAAAVAQEQGVTIEQVNECLNEADLDGDGVVTVVELEEWGVVIVSSASASSSASAAVAVLPETGGASLFALGAGALLVAGGLVARRILR